MMNKGMVFALQSLGINPTEIMESVGGVVKVATEIDARISRIESKLDAIAAHLNINPETATATLLIGTENDGHE